MKQAQQMSRDRTPQRVVGGTLGGLAGMVGGRAVGQQLMKTPGAREELARAVLTHRATGNAIPAMMAHAKRIVPLTVLLAALGTIAGYTGADKIGQDVQGDAEPLEPDVVLDPLTKKPLVPEVKELVAPAKKDEPSQLLARLLVRLLRRKPKTVQ